MDPHKRNAKAEMEFMERIAVIHLGIEEWTVGCNEENGLYI